MSGLKRKTIADFGKMKATNEKIVMLTAYDAPTAAIAAAAGVDLLLVGDSVAMTTLGYRNTLPLTLDESLHHCRAVRRGAPDAFIIGDMPFLSFGCSIEESLRNAGRYLKEADCDAVKLEGGADVCEIVDAMTRTGIPVVAHIGLLPQKVLISGYKVQGKKETDAERLVADALKLQSAGAFMVVLECMPQTLSKLISETLDIPTIGIGGGVDCDGQVQVLHDVIGLFDGFVPKHAKHYAEVGKVIANALSSYVKEVKSGEFPTDAHSFH